MTYIPMENNEISVKHNGAAAQLLSIELLIFKSLLMGGDASEIKNVLSQVASFTKFVEGEENDRINQPEVSEKILKAFSDFEPNMQQEVIKVTEELFKEGMFISRFINQDYNGITDDQKMIINHVISAMLKAITEVVQYVGFITEFDSTLGYEEESVVTPEEVTEAAKKVGNVTFVNPFLASMIQEMDKQREEAKAAKEGRTK